MSRFRCSLQVVLSLALAGLTQAQSGLPTLFESPAYETGVVPGSTSRFAPQATAAGDLNADGWPELVIADLSGKGLQVRFGAEQLAFSNPVAVGAGSSYVDVLAADLDDDGDLDLVALDDASSSNVHTFVNDGAGGFAVAAVASTGGAGEAITTGDLDGDGLLDVVAACRDTGELVSFLGTGGGALAAGIASTALVGLLDVELGDVDGNGTLDAVTANGSAGSTSRLLGDGSGGFGPPAQTASVTPESVQLGDLDGDGDLDLVTVSKNPASLIRTARNTNGSFAPWVGSPLPAPATSIVLGHLDDDGQLDALVGYWDFNLTAVSVVEAAFFLGDGAGGFQLGASVGRSSTDSTLAVALADMDLDGALDALVANSSRGAVSVFRGTGAGGVLQSQRVSGGTGERDVAAGDLDGDGVDDLVIANIGTSPGTGFISVLLATGPGSFGSNVDFGFQVDRLRLADVNADGALDVVYGDGTAAGQWCVSLGDGAGNLASPTCRGVGTVNEALLVEDMTGDGVPDLVGFRAQDDVLILPGDGVGGFTGVLQTTSVGGTLKGIEAVDLNADGAPDVVVCDSANDLLVLLLNDGTGNLGARIDVDPGLEIDGDVVVLDVDRDGHLDLVTVSAFAGSNTELVVVPGLGGLFFGVPRTYRSGILEQLQAVDVDRDGWLDLVTLSVYSAFVIRADGLGGFLPTERYSTGPSPRGFDVADQDQDGWVDIFHADPVAGGVYSHWSLAPENARATIRNGAGTNPLAFTPAGAPVLGAVWNCSVSSNGFPAATSSIVVVTDRGLSGAPTPYGELLIAVAPLGPTLASDLQPLISGAAAHAFFVPNDLALVGQTVSAQAVLVGGGPVLCNAIDLALGL